MTAKEAAANGAALLDKELPGWHKKIDVKTLFIGSSAHCVMGQLGWDMLPRIETNLNYRRRTLRLRAPRPYMIAGGRGRQNGFFCDPGEHTYGELTLAWKEEILARSA